MDGKGFQALVAQLGDRRNIPTIACRPFLRDGRVREHISRRRINTERVTVA